MGSSQLCGALRADQEEGPSELQVHSRIAEHGWIPATGFAEFNHLYFILKGAPLLVRAGAPVSVRWIGSNITASLLQ